MKIRSLHGCALLILALGGGWSPAADAQAQAYKVTCFRLSGGSTSTGGVFSLKATIGCTDVGAVSNSIFTLDEGAFCRLPAGLTPLVIAGAPILRVSWPATEYGLHLYRCDAISSESGWVLIPPDLYQASGLDTFVDLGALPAAGFYRLHGPP